MAQKTYTYFMKGGRVSGAGILILVVLWCGCGEDASLSGIRVSDSVYLLDFFSQAEKRTEVSEDWKSPIHATQVVIEGEESRVLFLHPTSEITFPLRMEMAGVFDTAIGLKPEAWQQQSDGATFYVLVREEGGYVPTYLYVKYLNPALAREYPGWLPVRIDLTAYQGKNIELTLRTDPGPNSNFLYDWAIWKDPRIYNPATD